MRRSELVRALATIPDFESAKPALEQVRTPVEAACELLEAASARDDLTGRPVADLGCGTGLLAIGAALLGAAPVVGVEIDPTALVIARAAADRLGVRVQWTCGDVGDWRDPVDTVLMNPPFGAQRAHADRPFWESAFANARRRVYAFSSADSRSFIERRAVAHAAHIEETRSVAWPFPRTFPHHRKGRSVLAVDLWVLAIAPPP